MQRGTNTRSAGNGQICLKCQSRAGEGTAFTRTDVGKEVSIKRDVLHIDGEPRYVSWKDARHQDCSGKIKSVEEIFKGKVQLENEQEFENGEGINKCYPLQWISTDGHHRLSKGCAFCPNCVPIGSLICRRGRQGCQHLHLTASRVNFIRTRFVS